MRVIVACVVFFLVVSGAFAVEPALEVAGKYLKAMETGDLELAGRLFPPESSVF